MVTNAYLKWMADNSATMYCNDSALMADVDAALENGAIGVTSNPPLSYQALTETAELYAADVAKIPQGIDADDRCVELIGCVVKKMSQKLMPMFEATNGKFGYIRSQVQPLKSADADAMLAQGKTMASWGKNVMVKIPGTEAGIKVLEELAALGIPTNPTVCVTVSQMVEAARAHERGAKRAIAAGLKPAKSTAAFVMGRLQDYLSVLNTERNLGLTKPELDVACLAVAKRCVQIYQREGFASLVMPAAFRASVQVEGLIGCECEMTIHPKVQAELIVDEAAGNITRKMGFNEEIDQAIINKVAGLIPEFKLAYEENAIAPKDFDTFGATAMTLDGFNTTGWQKLLTL